MILPRKKHNLFIPNNMDRKSKWVEKVFLISKSFIFLNYQIDFQLIPHRGVTPWLKNTAVVSQSYQNLTTKCAQIG